MFYAELDTGHSTLRGFGRTEDEARTATMDAWYRHADLYGADPDNAQAEDVNVIEFQPGQGFLDFSLYTGPASGH